MKLLVLLSCFFLSFTCNKAGFVEDQSKCYKAKLLIKGLCMNYVIQVIDGNVGEGIASAWEHPVTGAKYKNVFALGSKCNFPSNINEGDEFNFKILTEPVGQECVVCMAYSPVPPVSLFIEVCR
jgi:hypothetical protein